MTEREWLECGDLDRLLTFLNATVGERKFRLTECAFLRRLWPLLTDERSRRAVEVAERLADGHAARGEYRAACADAAAAFLERLTDLIPDRESVVRPFWGGAVTAAQHAAASAYDVPEVPGRFRSLANLGWIATAAYPVGDAAAEQGAYRAIEAAAEQVAYRAIEAEQRGQAALLRELFNPFHPAAPDLRWLTPDVAPLAEAAYEQRELPSGHLDPTRLAVLSDALEDAGCDDADLLSHLRSSGPHVRGCWAVDLLTGRS